MDDTELAKFRKYLHLIQRKYPRRCDSCSRNSLNKLVAITDSKLFEEIVTRTYHYEEYSLKKKRIKRRELSPTTLYSLQCKDSEFISRIQDIEIPGDASIHEVKISDPGSEVLKELNHRHSSRRRHRSSSEKPLNWKCVGVRFGQIGSIGDGLYVDKVKEGNPGIMKLMRGDQILAIEGIVFDELTLYKLNQDADIADNEFRSIPLSVTTYYEIATSILDAWISHKWPETANNNPKKPDLRFTIARRDSDLKSISPDPDPEYTSIHYGARKPRPLIKTDQQTDEDFIEIQLVDFPKTHSGVGAFLTPGPYGIGAQVERLAKGELAEEDGRLQVDDNILYINENPVMNKSFREILEVYQQVSSRAENSQSQSSVSPLQPIRLIVSRPVRNKQTHKQHRITPPHSRIVPQHAVLKEAAKLAAEIEEECKSNTLGTELNIEITNFDDSPEHEIFINLNQPPPELDPSNVIFLPPDLDDLDSEFSRPYGIERGVVIEEAVSASENIASSPSTERGRHGDRLEQSIVIDDENTTVERLETEMAFKVAKEAPRTNGIEQMTVINENLADEAFKVRTVPDPIKEDGKVDGLDGNDLGENTLDEISIDDIEEDSMPKGPSVLEQGKEDSKDVKYNVKYGDIIEGIFSKMESEYETENAHPSSDIDDESHQYESAISNGFYHAYPARTSSFKSDKNSQGQILNDEKRQLLINHWKNTLDTESEIIIGEYKLPAANTPLGISVETVASIDMGGNQLDFRHRIVSLKEDGIIANQTDLKPEDEIIEVNGVVVMDKDSSFFTDTLRKPRTTGYLVCSRPHQLEASKARRMPSFDSEKMPTISEAPSGVETTHNDTTSIEIQSGTETDDNRPTVEAFSSEDPCQSSRFGSPPEKVQLPQNGRKMSDERRRNSYNEPNDSSGCSPCYTDDTVEIVVSKMKGELIGITLGSKDDVNGGFIVTDVTTNGALYRTLHSVADYCGIRFGLGDTVTELNGKSLRGASLFGVQSLLWGLFPIEGNVNLKFKPKSSTLKSEIRSLGEGKLGKGTPYDAELSRLGGFTKYPTHITSSKLKPHSVEIGKTNALEKQPSSFLKTSSTMSNGNRSSNALNTNKTPTRGHIRQLVEHYSQIIENI